MDKQTPNPASEKEQAEGSRENVNVDSHAGDGRRKDMRPDSDLPGKTDSGPEPDVFGREIPPQD